MSLDPDIDTSLDALPPAHVCERARRSRDARFDGLFFTAVLSTRVYCRPVCPAPWASRVIYFASAAAAEHAGYRPCLRCRPEIAPGSGAWRRGDDVVTRALALIDDGLLDERSVGELAERLEISERQLRRLFTVRVGVTPLGIQGTRRLLFAKQLLTETTLPITRVALESGFRSLRRFNAAMREAYRMAPRDLRKRPRTSTGRGLTLRLGYRPPYDVAGMLRSLRERATPGAEVIDNESYTRLVACDARGTTWLRVTAWPSGGPALQLEVHGPVPKATLMGIVRRVRRMFDLDADPREITDALSASSVMAPLVRQRVGARITGGWDDLEVVVRAILGQDRQPSTVSAAMQRITDAYGSEVAHVPLPGLDRCFPTPGVLATADLTSVDLPASRASVVKDLARMLDAGELAVEHALTLEGFIDRWTAVPGVSRHAAHEIALRALGHPDALASDAPVRGEQRALLAEEASWRPWRAYALMHLTAARRATG